LAIGLISALNSLALWFVKTFGLGGVAVSMTLESALVPIPSEVVLPYAGFAQYNDGAGISGVFAVTLAATIGNVVGSWLLYAITKKEGRKILGTLQRLKLVRLSEIEMSERWYAKYGSVTIFFARLTPGLRTVIGLPAGLMKMSQTKFVVFTLLGSIPWNFMLTYLGYLAGPNWNAIISTLQNYELPIYIVVAAIVVFALFRFYMGGKAKAEGRGKGRVSEIKQQQQRGGEEDQEKG
jgi:membrane protein DedA with SNARE-associated domain